jgi:chromosome partitioning protein
MSVSGDDHVRTLAVINQKGGSGKTTTAINLAAVWAASGKRTLLIDVDPQSHCAAGLAVPEDKVEMHVGDAMLRPIREGFDLRQIAWRIAANLDLVPSTMQLAGLESARGGLADQPDRDVRLTHLVETIAPHYDACIIDCPPSIGLLTFNALRAAGEAIIPVETGYFALQGAHKQVNTIKNLMQRLERTIRYYLVPTLHRHDSRIAREILAALKNRFVQTLTPVVIHQDERLREAAGFGQSIVEYAHGSVGHRDYAALGAWLAEEHVAVGEPDGTPVIELARGAREALLRSAQAESDAATNSGPGIMPPTRLAPTTLRAIGFDRPADPRTHPIGPTPQRTAAQTDTSPEAAPVATSTQPSAQPAHPAPAPAPTNRAVELAARARLLAARSAALHQEVEERIERRAVEAETGTAAPMSDEAPSMVEPKPHMQRLLGARPTSMGVSFVFSRDAVDHVFLAGDFNDWSPTSCPLTFHREHGVWHACIELPVGSHCYRYVCDGEWLTDPHNEQLTPNPYGGYNSVVEVPPSSNGHAT